MSNTDTDKRRSSPQIGKLNAIECMKQLLLPPMPAELTQRKSDSPNLLDSIKKLEKNNEIHLWYKNENGSINDDVVGPIYPVLSRKKTK